MMRAAYLWVTLGLTVAAIVVATLAGQPAAAVAVGAGTAWLIQAASFWLLAGSLGRGERVTRVWIAGIASRFGVGVLVWALGALAGWPSRPLMIAYGMALVVFLLLEAGWLAVTTADPRVRR